MKKKKWITLALAAIFCTLAMTACQSNAAESQSKDNTAPSPSTATAGQENEKNENTNKKLTLWAGGSDNVNQQFLKQVAYFNKNNVGGYTVEFQFLASGTGAQGVRERMIAAKMAGQSETDFDLIELGGDEVMRYIAEGGEDIFVPLDKEKLPNIADLEFPATYRDDLVLPYRGTTVVLAYNSDVVPNPPKTAEELYQWIKDNPGRFAYNTPDSGGAGGSFVTTGIYNRMPEESLISDDAKWTEEWGEGFELLKDLHPYLYQSGGRVIYPHKNQGTLDLLANKEVDMIPAWADMAITQMREGILPESTQIAQISPAFTGSTVVLAIPSIGSNPEGAYAFMNYMLSPEAQNIALDTMAAIPVISFDKLDEELLPFIASLDIDSFRISSIGDLGTEMNERWQEEISILG